MSFHSFEFFSSLEPADVDWLVGSCVSRTVLADDTLVKEGTRLDAIYFIADGLFDVIAGQQEKVKLGRLGAGSVVGEMSWLDGRTASASVRAVESSEALALPCTLLDERLARDPGFAARFYRAMALLVADRLRVANRRAMTAAPAAVDIGDDIQRLRARVASFKQLLIEADKVLRAEPERMDAMALQATPPFVALCEDANTLVNALPDPRVAEAVGQEFQREMLPYILLAETAERFYSKPRGYAGDYHTIELIYRDQPSGTGRLGPLIDRLFLAGPPCVAVRNRRALVAGLILDALDRHPGRPVCVTSMACGPARELLDVFEGPRGTEARERLFVTAIDIDLEALGLLRENCGRLGLERNVTPVHGNLIYLATGRQQVEMPPQDLIYSIGLIDYFNDPFVVKLMDWSHGRLAPGGRLVLGNFDPSNSYRALMDHVLEWRLIHRTGQDMDRLYRESAFKRDCTRVLFEEQRINLFAECERAA